MKRLFVCSFWSLWFACVVHAEMPLPAPLTLAEARRLAFERNWDLLAAKSDVDLATAQKIIAKEFPNPTFSISTTKINVDDHPSGRPGANGLWDRNYDTTFAINQLFEIGGKRASRQSSAAAGIEAAKARLADARRVLDFGVTRAYVAALLAGANTQILRQSAASLRKEAQIAETRLKAGDISLADKAQIEIAADRLELDAKNAESSAKSARLAVEVLLGTPNPAGAWAPGDSLETLAGRPFPAASETPGAARPDLLAAEHARLKADADLKLAKAQRIPDPTVLFQYEHEPFDQPNTLGIGISIPLPLWNRNTGNIMAAEAARDQAAIFADKLRVQIKAEITGARLAYDESSERLARYREQIQPKSAKIRETVSFAYQKGGASLLDLLSAERNDNDVRLATAQAAADTATAVATLKAALNSQDTKEKP
ncbi:MAG: TolC family protein [Verrucomicrobia bacterium]|nr:TolC family protein [Verrucomicrobiota bacterium]